MKHIALAFLCLTLSGCAAVVLGAGVGGSTLALQERSAGTAVDDTVIRTQIHNFFIQQDIRLFSDVSVKVTEGRVMLTGFVLNPQTRVDAVRLAWQPKGVKEVINEIQVTDATSFKDYATDTWITTQVKSKLLVNGNIRSVNYSIETVGRVVYLMGIAQNQHELDEVTSIASQVSGVTRVISHVRITGQE